MFNNKIYFKSFALLLGHTSYMQAASINTSPNMAQYHSGLALKLIVIFFCVSPSRNE